MLVSPWLMRRSGETKSGHYMIRPRFHTSSRETFLFVHTPVSQCSAPHIAMNDSCRDLLIAWSLLPFLSPSRTRLLLEFYDPPERALYASVETLQGLLKVDAEQAALVRRPFRDPSRIEALRDSVITLADGEYPLALKEIVDPPL